jgi:DNA-binding transcriptional LysR family regulator
MMNVHHLELFYYVAKHEGIVAACRHIPYGVQQPAVSAQLLRLEEDLGVKLFERRPFALTDAGRVLFDFIAPFFGRLDEIEGEVRGRLAQRLRLAGPTQVMRDHLPEMLSALRKQFPKLRITLVEGSQRSAELAVTQGEADMGVTVLESALAPGLRSITLVKLPLVLLVHQSSPHRRAADVLQAGVCGRLDLIALPPSELMPRLFHATLRKRNKVWPVAMEVSSTDLVAEYVAHGLGVGLSMISPRAPVPSNVRRLPLKGFPPLPVGAFWRGKPGPIGTAFVDILKARGELVAKEVAEMLAGPG